MIESLNASYHVFRRSMKKARDQMKENKIKRAKDLIDQINYHDRLYFTENRQEISDEAYDELWFELKDLMNDEEVKNSSKKMKMPLGSQTSFLDKVTHLVPILSLDKIKSKDQSFNKNIKKFVDKYSTRSGYLIQSKLDGLTVVMYKSNDGKVTFATRGGSNQGENVTDQMMKISGIKEASEKCENGVIIRGEVIIRKNDFKQSDRHSNARNAVSGALRSKEIGSAAEIGARYVTYDILSSHSTNEIDDLELLESLGFETVDYQYLNALSKAEDLSKRVLELIDGCWREESEYELDGLVIKPIVKNENVYDGDGHHAKGQIAVKFPPKGDVTYLRDIEFTIGKDGRMTPVAIYDEIEIDGVKMSRASVGSWSNLQKLDVKIGDKIFVIRSNDVIPQIDTVLERFEDSKEILQPKETWLDGSHLYTEVSEPIEDKIAKSASALKIKSFNARSYKLLIEADLIEEFVDLFKLKNLRDKMLRIKGLGQKKVDSLLNEIELARKSDFEQFLNSVQLLHVGAKNCKEIASRCKTLEDFFNLDIDQLKSINVKSKESLRSAQKNRDIIAKIYNELDLSKE